MTTLQGRGFVVELRASPLAIIVTRPDDPTGAVQTITCKPRVIDQDRMWFFNAANNEAFAEADDITGAAVIIVGHLSPAP
ncbi:hypothetical protein [Actinomadura macra]|uniref:hypothetical protein n=1 Tax=Actinomadura macra TaxID=46164 RepID=UPI0008329EA8|nr:hypothetical protein [Actinomadura macra]